MEKGIHTIEVVPTGKILQVEIITTGFMFYKVKFEGEYTKWLPKYHFGTTYRQL